MKYQISIVLLLVVCGVAFFLSGSEKKPVSAQSEAEEELNRGQLLALIQQAEAAFKADPDSVEQRVELATLHYQAGHFETAYDLVAPVFESSPEALELMVNLEYLFGHYDRVEELVQQALASNPMDFEAQILGQLMLGNVYYHTNRFAEVQGLIDTVELVRSLGGELDLTGVEEWARWMASFEDPPYQLDWGSATETVLPFLATDPLPIVEVMINGTPIYAIVDTGGGPFVLDTDLAASLGVETVTTFAGSYASGLQAETGLVKADSLTLGDVTIRSVPMMTLPMAEMTAIFPYPIQGVLTTNVLEQFLGTIDYPAGELVLRPKTEESLAAVQQQNAGKTVVEVPFYLVDSHYMMVKGTLNGDDDMTFFVDSGLVAEAAMTAPTQTLDYLGIPVPEMIVPESGGGGGGVYAAGIFSIETLGLGPLRQENVMGEHGSMAPETYWGKGFIQDGLISHRFLRHYAWTIDFTNRVMIFAAPE